MVANRSGDGRFTPEYTDEELLAALRAHEPAATSEVADELGMTRQGADSRLRALRAEGRVTNKKVGATLVWFFPDDRGSGSPEVSPRPPDDAETLADCLGGFGMLAGDAGEEFAAAVTDAREEMGEGMEDRTDALLRD